MTEFSKAELHAILDALKEVDSEYGVTVEVPSGLAGRTRHDAEFEAGQALIAKVRDMHTAQPGLLAPIPLYQPGNTKVLEIILTEEQWFALAGAAVSSDGSLQGYINDLLREVADGLPA